MADEKCEREDLIIEQAEDHLTQSWQRLDAANKRATAAQGRAEAAAVESNHAHDRMGADKQRVIEAEQGLLVLLPAETLQQRANHAQQHADRVQQSADRLQTNASTAQRDADASPAAKD